MKINAAIYIADPSMLGSRFFDRIDGVQSYESISEGETATGVCFKMTWGVATMHFTPPGDLQEHLKGFAGYAQHVIRDKDTLAYALMRIRYVRMLLGCVIDCDEEQTEEVLSFLFSFNSNLCGLLFFEDTIFDFAGEPLGGPAAVKE
jgi:hypothetical protein